MPGSPQPLPGRPSAWRARAIVAALAFAAYLPSLFGGFVFDDERFVEKNRAVHELTARNLVRYFTDPMSVAAVGQEGIYRPLRTLDFAIDWTISGGTPWFFHLRNVLYHVLGCLLLLAVLKRLPGLDGPEGGGALFGAALFAVHPVNSECVAWVTSRGDLLLLVGFLFALLLHMKGRRPAALGVLVVALFSKEAAVVFPAAALLIDLLRGERLRWRWYGVYGAAAVGFALLWLQFRAGGEVARMGHLQHFWGGSYGANLLTMSKGFLYYLKLIVFPVRLVVDYHVPSTVTLDASAALSIIVLLTIALAALLSGPRSRFALAWFCVAILPMSNLVRPIGIPTAERFLYLPLVGVAVWAGPFFARHLRIACVTISCFLLLTFVRCFDWRSIDALWDATQAVAATPRELGHRTNREFELALEANERADRGPLVDRAYHLSEMARHVRAAAAKADELIALYRDVIRLPPGEIGSKALTDKAKALLLLGRPREALVEIDAAIKLHDLPDAYYHAGVALTQLGRNEEAALNIEHAVAMGYQGAPDYRAQLMHLWNQVGAKKEGAGDRAGALAAYRRSLEKIPGVGANPVATDGVLRLQ